MFYSSTSGLNYGFYLSLQEPNTCRPSPLIGVSYFTVALRSKTRQVQVSGHMVGCLSTEKCMHSESQKSNCSVEWHVNFVSSKKDLACMKTKCFCVWCSVRRPSLSPLSVLLLPAIPCLSVILPNLNYMNVKKHPIPEHSCR